MPAPAVMLSPMHATRTGSAASTEPASTESVKATNKIDRLSMIHSFCLMYGVFFSVFLDSLRLSNNPNSITKAGTAYFRRSVHARRAGEQVKRQRLFNHG
jgi:hypothetical protein